MYTVVPRSQIQNQIKTRSIGHRGCFHKLSDVFPHWLGLNRALALPQGPRASQASREKNSELLFRLPHNQEGDRVVIITEYCIVYASPDFDFSANDTPTYSTYA